MNIKRMNLWGWMLSEFKRQLSNPLLGSDRYPQYKVIIGSNGIYKKGSDCWLEINGKSFLYPVEQFNYDFKIIEVNEYDIHEINALNEIVKLKLATKEQKHIVAIHKLHGKKLDVEKLRIRKRFIAFKNKATVHKKIMAKV